MIKTYYLLTKPGIIMGNIITTGGGFILASRGHIDPWLFLSALIGVTFVIASACVFNNYIDRDLDRKMARTKNRPLAKGMISGEKALVYAAGLGFFGFWVLLALVNFLTACVALAGFLVYVVLYGICKSRTVYGTLIGSVAGALPPVIGYCAASNSFDSAAFLLFAIVVLWQMPHFFAIAMYRFTDYAAAAIPVMPVKKGVYRTKIHMLFYIAAFIVAALMLTVLGYTGYVYLATALVLGLAWLGLCAKGFKAPNDKAWAYQMFAFSLVVIMGLSIMISIDGTKDAYGQPLQAQSVLQSQSVPQ